MSTSVLAPPQGGLMDVFAVDSETHSTTYAVAHDVASFIDRSFEEALPYQYLRELVLNSQEAGATQVIMEPDWVYVESCVAAGVDPVYRWSLWDNGSGMDDDKLMRFHKVFDSTKGNMRGRHSNFGMGAKIAGYPINPNGMVVMSWQNGEGNMIVLHRDENTGQYGLYRQHVEVEGGEILRLEVAPTPVEYDEYYDIDGKSKKRIDGTLVIFTGTAPTDHTYLGPTNREWKTVSRTIRTNTLELNTRYARLNTSDFKVHVYGVAYKDPSLWAPSRADASGKVPPTHPRHNMTTQSRYGQYRLVQGCFVYWDEACSHQGTVKVRDGKVHWWLFDHVDDAAFRKKDAFRVQNGLPKAGKLAVDPKTGLFDTYKRAWDRHSYTPGPGMLAILYKNEMYNHRRTGQHHTYNFFGIYDSDVRRRLVIVAEPDYTDDSGVWPNAVRSALEYEGSDQMPWAEWGADFAANMPPVIKAILESGGGQFRDTVDFHDRINSLVKEIGTRYGLYTGAMTTQKSKAPVTGTGTGAGTGQRRVVRRRKPKVRLGGNAMPAYDVVDADKLPNQPRPAMYNRAARKLDVFASYHIFQTAIHHWQATFAHKPGADSIIEDTVLEVYTAMLLARIIHVLSLEGDAFYPAPAFDIMLSQEAFVTAVAGFLDADSIIKAKLNGKLGSHKQRAATSVSTAATA